MPEGDRSPHRAGGPTGGGPTTAPVSGRRPLDAVLVSCLGRALERAATRVRWGIGTGGDEASAAQQAAEALERARAHGATLGFATGDAWRDAMLADLGLALVALLDDLTPRQAEIAGLMLVDGARQAEVADRLGVSRATVSVAVARGRFAAIAGARRAIEALLDGPPLVASGRGPDDGLADAAG
jgi:DNA-binding CsgD family transcriptional regulator